MAKPLLAVIIAGLASNVECPVLQWLAMSEAARRPIRMAERVGFEPTCPLRDKTLSRRPRYDHFGTSPGRVKQVRLKADTTSVACVRLKADTTSPRALAGARTGNCIRRAAVAAERWRVLAGSRTLRQRPSSPPQSCRPRQTPTRAR